MNLGNATPPAKTFRITHLDDQRLYMSLEEEILMIQAGDAFIKNYQKVAPFHVKSFKDTPRNVLRSFRFSTWIKKKRSFRHLDCSSTQIFSKQKILSLDYLSVYQYFAIFRLHCSGKSNKWEAKTEMREEDFCWKQTVIPVQQGTFPPIKKNQTIIL